MPCPLRAWGHTGAVVLIGRKGRSETLFAIHHWPQQVRGSHVGLQLHSFVPGILQGESQKCAQRVRWLPCLWVHTLWELSFLRACRPANDSLVHKVKLPMLQDVKDSTFCSPSTNNLSSNVSQSFKVLSSVDQWPLRIPLGEGCMLVTRLSGVWMSAHTVNLWLC